MKRYLPLLLASFLIHSTLSAQYEWRRKACPALYQGGGTSFVVGNKAYVVGGDTLPPSAVNITAAVWEYNVTTDSWTRKNNFPFATNNPACFVINDTAYAGLGLDNTSAYHSEFYRYDQANDQWVQVAVFPGTARYGAMSFALHGKGYVGCGHGSGEYNDLYMYDPHQNTWTSRANLTGAARQAGIGAAAGGKGYMGLGAGGGNSFNDIYQYNDTTNSWMAIATLGNAGRYSAGSFTLNDTLYIVGGMNSNAYFYDCQSYSPSGNNWSPQAGFGHLCPDSVFVQDAFVISGHAYTRPLHSYLPLHLLLEFGPADPTFVQQVSTLGNDTTYTTSFSRVLTAPDTSAVWSTGVRGAQITVTSPGTYWARWDVACGAASDTIHLLLNVGISTVSGNEDIHAFPNPVNGNTIDLQVGQHMIGSTYSLYDLGGRLISTGQVTSVHSQIVLPESVGIYSLSVKTGEDVVVLKIVKLQ